MRRPVLLSMLYGGLLVGAGIVLATLDVVEVSPSSTVLLYLVELALILTLFSDGLFVEAELLREHWGPTARALVLALPLALVLLALAGKALFPELSYFTLFAPMAIILAIRPTGLFGRV